MGLEGIEEYIFYLRNVNASLKEVWRVEILDTEDISIIIQLALYFEDIYYLNTVVKLGINEGKDLFVENVERLKDTLQYSNKDILKQCGLTQEDIEVANNIKEQITPDLGIDVEKMFDNEFSIEGSLNKIIEMTAQLGNNSDLDYMMEDEDNLDKEDEDDDEEEMSEDLLGDILGALNQIKEDTNKEVIENEDIKGKDEIIVASNAEKEERTVESKKKRVKVKYDANDELAQTLYNICHMGNIFDKKKG